MHLIESISLLCILSMLVGSVQAKQEVEIKDVLVLDETIPISYIPSKSRSGESKGDVLLLHGARYDANTWVETGTLNALSEAGYNSIAVNLPGIRKGVRPADLLLGVLAAFGLETPCLVSPSLSGKYSLPLLTEYSSKLSSFVPIAPVFYEGFSASNLPSIPTLVVWGGEDKPGEERSKILLNSMEGSQAFKIEGAEHACYLEKQNAVVFNAALVKFLNTLQ